MSEPDSRRRKCECKAVMLMMSKRIGLLLSHCHGVPRIKHQGSQRKCRYGINSRSAICIGAVQHCRRQNRQCAFLYTVWRQITTQLNFPPYCWNYAPSSSTGSRKTTDALKTPLKDHPEQITRTLPTKMRYFNSNYATDGHNCRPRATRRAVDSAGESNSR